MEEDSKQEKEVKNVEKKTGFKLKKSEMWKYLSILLIILLAVSVAMYSNKSGSSGALSSQAAADKSIKYINDNLLQPGSTATLNNVKEDAGVYIINISIGGREYLSYSSLDGKLLFTNGIDMDQKVPETNATQTAQPQKPVEVTKSDKPKVDLFIMTHCPYGTQAEKGIIPAMEAIKDKADVKVRFVHYFMHGDKEEQETYTQICIREEQNAKFWPYLKCFLNASDSAGCIKSTGVDSAKLDTCVKDKAKTYYAADSDLSKKYGVQGSPTMVINGGQADFYPRSPLTALSTICAAFNKAPSECSAKLSADNPAPGFGYTATPAATGATAASCG